MKHETPDDSKLPPPAPTMRPLYRRSVVVEKSSAAKTRPLVEGAKDASESIQQKRNERRLLARVSSLEERVGILEAFIRNLPRRF